MRELNWQNLIKHFKDKKAIFAYKIKNNIQVPQSIANKFQIKDNSNYNLRSNNRHFLLDRPKTNFMKKSITYTTAATWNNLPMNTIEQGISLNKFKSLLDRAENP